MATFNLIQAVLGNLAQVATRGTGNVVKFGRTSDEPTTHLASRTSHGLASRSTRIDWQPRCVDLTDPVRPVSSCAYSPKAARPCMNENGLRTGRSAA
jgi:hypothetical protein